MPDNLLYYGDNLDVLRRHIKDESVDLVYLDPPFNSNASYNVLFAEQDGARAASQIKAFEDTWKWDQAAAAAYEETVEAGGKVSDALRAFRTLLGPSNMLAYLAMMAPRLVELRRVLKPTGSLYLHCDSTSSHYLKLLLDSVFAPRCYRNEVIWKRTTAHNDPSRWGRIHDAILFYTKSKEHTWNDVYQPFSGDYLDDKYRFTDERGRYRLDNLTAPSHGSSGREAWRGFVPPAQRMWRCTLEKLDALDAAGRIYWTPTGRHGGPGFPQLKQYLNETTGVQIQDIITDIPPINSQAQERLGYPTQKPEALLDRIIRASSNEGDTVLDPFCGCGTAVVVAQRLNRRWIGVDITHLAINLMKRRLHDTFGDGAMYKVVGEPVSLPDAEALAASDPYQFQWWALGLVGARPVEQKKGGDHGIDGRLFFHDEGEDGATKQVVLSVKAGHTQPAHVRDLAGVLAREGADIGVLLTMNEPSAQMRAEAAGAGFYHSPGWNKDYARLQILTVAELLAGKSIAMPPLRQVSATFRRAPRAKGGGEQPKLTMGE